MKFNWNKITIITALILSGFAFYSFNKKNENRLATGLDISILPSKDSYLSKDSIRSILNPFLGDEKKSIDLNLRLDKLKKYSSSLNLNLSILSVQ